MAITAYYYYENKMLEQPLLASHAAPTKLNAHSLRACWTEPMLAARKPTGRKPLVYMGYTDDGSTSFAYGQPVFASATTWS